ncbi:hypothetical protein CEUSTIGMA_g2936.t1 [Chlamydomonas eustigma]|uniref:Trs120/TRAPPC9 N-terminal domain-containing protein n=1 Tax=Chlamydomonas eustigma TaxID=1157962 RepID=A0A250WXC8_9CHLO|nr:hypothetical protein CEUSTIGMA_g2936.t1 [Chlamydomonas eustigma]|eukprot:GAX75493.1 hypothetical protein CEUSTIGMA_g2936.t1 [Chlamydomonas eustigma]
MPSGIRTLFPGITVLSNAEIQVAVVPVGTVPKDLQEEYMRLIMKFRTPSLRAVQSFYKKHTETSPFQDMNWTTGALHLRFALGEDAKFRSRLADLHPHRQILAVIGLLHCPTCPNLDDAYSNFRDTCKLNFPEAQVLRCFAFEPSERHIQKDGEKHTEGLVMFPPGGLSHVELHLEVWMHDLAALILAELERWAMDPGRGLQRHGYTDSNDFVGAVPVMEEVNKLRLAITEDEVKEKRKRGRMHKVLGDLSLLAGSPQDALINFKVAQDLSRATGDWVWCGAAMEGTVAARLLDLTPQPTALQPTSSTSPATLSSPKAASEPSEVLHSAVSKALPGQAGQSGLPHSASRSSPKSNNFSTTASGWPSWTLVLSRGIESELKELMLEARACYKKKGSVAVMQVEHALKLGRLLACLHGTTSTSRREVLDLASAAMDVASSAHYLDERIMALVEVADLCGLAGAFRRRTLLMWQAVEMSRSALASLATSTTEGSTLLAAQWGAVRLKYALAAMDIPVEPLLKDVSLTPVPWYQRLSLSLASTAVCGPSGSTDLSGEGWGALRGAWHKVQVVVLEQLLQAARREGAAEDAWETAAALLRYHHEGLSSKTHAALIEVLVAASTEMPSQSRIRSGRGPPCPLATLKRVIPPPGSLQPHQVSGLYPAPGSGSAAGGSMSTGGGNLGRTSTNSPFIFNPYAGKRKELEQKQRGKKALGSGEDALAAVPEWVCREEGRVDVILCNPLAVPVKIESITLQAEIRSPEAASDMVQVQRQEEAEDAGPLSNIGVEGPKRVCERQPQSTAASCEWQPQSTAASCERLPQSTAASCERLPQSTAASCERQPQSTAASCAAAASAAGQSVREVPKSWWPVPLTGLSLPPNGKPVRVTLSGMPLLPGILSLTGITINAFGAQWFEPFCRDSKKVSSGLGNMLAPQDSQPVVATLTVVSGLPLLTAELKRKSGAILALAPPHEELSGVKKVQHLNRSNSNAFSAAVFLTEGSSQGMPTQQQSSSLQRTTSPSFPLSPTSSNAGAGSTDFSNSGPVPVWQGQCCAWELHLTNIGTADVSSALLTVVNHRGVQLRPLPQGRMSASSVGAHLEPAAGGLLLLAAALPLAPGSSVKVPVDVLVGNPAAREAFDASKLEVRVAYTGPSVNQCEEPTTASPLGRPTSISDHKVFLGRLLVMPLQFQVQPTLQVSGIQLLDHYAPLKDGYRCWPLAAPSVEALHTPNPSPARLSATVMTTSRQDVASSAQGSVSQKVTSVPSAAAAAAPSAAHRQPSASLLRQSLSVSRVESAESMLRGLSEKISKQRSSTQSKTNLPASNKWPSASYQKGRDDIEDVGVYSASQINSWGDEVELSFSDNASISPTGDSLKIMRIGMTSDCSLQVNVASRSDRYLRVRLERMKSRSARGGSYCGTDTTHAASVPFERMSIKQLSDDFQSAGEGGDGDYRIDGDAKGRDIVLPPREHAPLLCFLRRGDAAGASLAAAEKARRTSFSSRQTRSSSNRNRPSMEMASSAASLTVSGPSEGGRIEEPASQLSEEPNRLAAAELVCDQWAVYWHMIGVEEDTPQGVIPLSSVDVARMLTPHAISCLQPSLLSCSLMAVYTMRANGPVVLSTSDSDIPVAGSRDEAGQGVVGCASSSMNHLPWSPRPRIQDLTKFIQGSKTIGGMWGVRVSLGHVLHLDLELCNQTESSQLVQLSFGVENLIGNGLLGHDPGGPGGVVTLTDALRTPSLPRPDTTLGFTTSHPVDPGVALLGQVDNIQLRVNAGSTAKVQVAMLLLRPGVYQVYARDLFVIMPSNASSPRVDGPSMLLTVGQQLKNITRSSGQLQAGPPVYFNMQRLNIVCL